MKLALAAQKMEPSLELLRAEPIAIDFTAPRMAACCG